MSEGLVAARHPLQEVAEKYWVPSPDVVAKLPRVTCKQCSDSPRKHCDQHTKKNCAECHQFITERHIHLDYVGHPDVNRVLTEIDPWWMWEPAAVDERGLPLIDVQGNVAVLWGRMTLLNKTVLCVGSCENKKFDRDKELIGDLIRNGAMRHNIFGALWSKAERVPDDRERQEQRPRRARTQPPANVDTETGEVRRNLESRTENPSPASRVKAALHGLGYNPTQRKQFVTAVIGHHAENVNDLSADELGLVLDAVARVEAGEAPSFSPAGCILAWQAGEEPFEVNA